MNVSVHQPIKIGDKYVFLILTGQTGPDFTFYLRNDDANLVRRILQKESGLTIGEAGDGEAKTDAHHGAPPKQKSSYSCRINILRLDKKDLEIDKGQFVLLSELRKAAQKQEPPSRYNRLRAYLSDDCKSRLNDERNKELPPTLLPELCSLLKGDRIKELFTTPPDLTAAEAKLINQPEVRPNEVFVNYIKFCALFNDAVKPLESRLREGRVLAGLSYKGNIWSLTFREQESDTGYDPDTKEVRDLGAEGAEGNLNSIEALCETLYEEIFCAVGQCGAAQGSNEKPAGDAAVQQGGKEGYKVRIDRHRKMTLPEMHGLAVIAGSTNSAKSLITRGLIHLYLENVIGNENLKRRPHLISFEDPIERYFAGENYTPPDAHPQLDVEMEALWKGVDYTPRQQKKDRRGLQKALRDALRQTPKVFFVGETRKKEDWQELIDFAGTGHLVITTTHASSLLDTMHKIFLATEATTAADRSEVASRLLAVVHIKRAEVSGYPFGALVPALWRRVPRGLNALTAEGLASVLPHGDSDARNPSSCLGRKYFAERLLELAEFRNGNPPGKFKERLISKAIDWDLQGA